MHSLRLWTRMFKAFQRIHLNKRLFSEFANEPKLAVQQKIERIHVNFLQTPFGKSNKTLARNVASYISAIEGTSQISASHLEKLVSRLNSDMSRLRRVHRSDVEHLLQDLQSEDILQDKQEVGMLLLHCCGNLLPDEHPAYRMDLVNEVWRILQNIGVSFSVDHYNMLLRSYIENRHKIHATEFLTKMDLVRPNEMTYQLLLACVCEAGDVEQAVEVISRMKSDGFPASEAVFNSLILGHARAGDLAEVASVLDTMHTAHVYPTSDTYTALMKGYIEAGDIANVQKVYQKVEAANISISESQLMDILKSAAVSGNPSLIPEVLKLLPEGSVDATPAVINMTVHLVHLGCELAAYYILQAVPLDSVLVSKEDSSSFGSFLIQEMVKADRPPRSIIEICDLLAADGRNINALLNAAKFALLMARTKLALVVFKALADQGSPLRPHYFWPLFLSLGKQDGEKGVLSVLDYMKQFGVNVDFDTLVDYIIPQTSFSDPESLIRKLQTYGLQVGQLLTPVVFVLLKENEIRAAHSLCRKFQSPVNPERLLGPLVRAFLSTRDEASAIGLLRVMISTSAKEKIDWAGQFILEILVSKKNGSKNIDTILKMFQKENIPISSFAAEIITNYIARNGLSDDEIKNIRAVVDSLVHSGLSVSSTELFSQHIPHPRDMGLEELECHLVELKNKNLNTRGVLRRLLQLYCRQGNVEKAMEIKKEFEAGNYEFSAGMQASLLDLHLKLGNLDNAESALMELQKIAPNFSLDDHKILDFATLLVVNNKHRGAIAILEKHAGLQGVQGGPGIVRNCWKLLQALAEKGEPQRVKHMLELLITRGYCSISNILLGPLVRAHLIQGSLMGAVKEYKHCTAKYRMTPLQHELLCRLISITDNADGNEAQLLEEVIEATKSVHGSASVNVAVAIALAETGKTKQLRKLVMESSVKIKPSILVARCKRLADEGKLIALKNLSDVSKGIQNFDSLLLYTLMMKVYSQRGDCDGAFSLWMTLQEQDIQPSDTFLNTLASLLRSNNREVPFIVPSDGKRK